MNLILLIALVVAVGGVFLIVQAAQTDRAPLRSLGIFMIAIGLAVGALTQAFVIVPAGHVGVVFNVFGGVQDDELGEGFHIVVPGLQQVTQYDIRQHELTLATETNDTVTARSREGLEITVDVTVLFQPEPTNVARLHQDIGPSYQKVRVRPEVRTQIRDGIGQYDAADLISSQRTDLQLSVEESLRNALSKDNVTILSVLLRDVSIPESITTAIEEKQAAEQQVAVEENRRRQAEISAQRRVIEAEGERDAAIARAEGEAEALRLRGEAIRDNPEIIRLEVAQRLAPGLQTIMLPTDNNFLLDVRSLTGSGAAGNPPAQSP
ncbi:MAG: prohibitin family protein [Trueperaceae bacterium]|nr:prohibitin family protein [Trueperaceae bacterium]